MRFESDVNTIQPPVSQAPQSSGVKFQSDFEPSSSAFKTYADLNQKPSFLETAGKGLLEMALQPARFLERAGKGIGMIGLSPEQKAKAEEFMGPGLQERVGGKEYATPAYTNVKQAYGGAIQAGANLASPFFMTPAGMGVQGALLGGGKALEEGKEGADVATEAAIGGAAGYGLGKASQMAGGIIGKGKDYLVQQFRPIVKKIAPSLTGVSKGELNIAFEQVPDITAEKLKTMSSFENPADARAALQEQALNKTREVISNAKKAEQDAFEASINEAKNKFPEARADIQSVYDTVQKKVKDYGIPVGTEAREALNTVLDTIRKSASSYEPNIDGVRTLSRDLWSIVDQTEEGTPAHAAAVEAWGELRKQLSSMTNKELDPAMERYAIFKANEKNLKPAWSQRGDQNQARTFVSNLESSAKSASRESLKALEEAAGMTGHATNDVTINRLMSKLAKSEKVTGSRLVDILLAGTIFSGAGAVGEAVGGEKGKIVGQTIGALGGARILAPDIISKILLSGMETSGQPVTNEIRQAIGKIVSDPKTAQALRNALLQAPQSESNVE